MDTSAAHSCAMDGEWEDPGRAMRGPAPQSHAASLPEPAPDAYDREIKGYVNRVFFQRSQQSASPVISCNWADIDHYGERGQIIGFSFVYDHDLNDDVLAPSLKTRGSSPGSIHLPSQLYSGSCAVDLAMTSSPSPAAPLAATGNGSSINSSATSTTAGVLTPGPSSALDDHLPPANLSDSTATQPAQPSRRAPTGGPWAPPLFRAAAQPGPDPVSTSAAWTPPAVSFAALSAATLVPASPAAAAGSSAGVSASASTTIDAQHHGSSAVAEPSLAKIPDHPTSIPRSVPVLTSRFHGPGARMDRIEAGIQAGTGQTPAVPTAIWM
ncbi:hypothetical protein V8E36_000794 [Tilletia maclaganii]